MIGCIRKIKAYANKAVLRLELLGNIDGIVHKSKTSTLATTKLAPKAKDIDLVGILGLELLSKYGLELLLGDVSASLVKDVDNLMRKNQLQKLG